MLGMAGGMLGRWNDDVWSRTAGDLISKQSLAASSSTPASCRLRGGTERSIRLVQEERHPLRGEIECLDAEIPRVQRWLHTGQTRDPNHDTVTHR